MPRTILQPLPSFRAVSLASKGVLLAAVLGLASCSQALKPSVPSQSGKTISDANEAFLSCAPADPQDRYNTVFEIRSVDKCLASKGYSRRVLTQEEVSFLKALDGYQRVIFLDHMVEGGTLAGFIEEYEVQ